jgi:hypothetical protein
MFGKEASLQAPQPTACLVRVITVEFRLNEHAGLGCRPMAAWTERMSRGIFGSENEEKLVASTLSYCTDATNEPKPEGSPERTHKHPKEDGSEWIVDALQQQTVVWTGHGPGVITP